MARIFTTHYNVVDAAAEARERSVREGCTITIHADSLAEAVALGDELACYCDDSVEVTLRRTEFWGSSDREENWRVVVVR